MPVIENTKGAATVDAAGGTYTFSQDQYGRFTAKITSMTAVGCFLGNPDRYREVPEHPLELDEDKPMKTITPAVPKNNAEPKKPTPAKKMTAAQKAKADEEAAKAAEVAQKQADEEAAKVAAAAAAEEAAKKGQGA